MDLERTHPVLFHLAVGAIAAVALTVGLAVGLGALRLAVLAAPGRRWLLAALLAVNLVSLVQLGLDKRRAQAGEWRIPEAALLAPTLLCADAGFLAGLLVFRHKTSKPAFLMLYAAGLAGRLLLAGTLLRRR